MGVEETMEQSFLPSLSPTESPTQSQAQNQKILKHFKDIVEQNLLKAPTPAPTASPTESPTESPTLSPTACPDGEIEMSDGSCKPDCAQEPLSVNPTKISEIGCSGAKYQNGDFAKPYCLNSAGSLHSTFKWYAASCKWQAGMCVEQAPTLSKAYTVPGLSKA